MKPRLRKTMLISALAATSVAVTGSPAHAATGMEVAIQDDGPLVTQSYFGREKALNLAAQLKVTRVRANVPWASVVNSARKKKRPKHRKFDFTAYDVLFSAARARGMKVQLTLTGPAPAWATGNHRAGGFKPKSTDFAEFARAAATHFRGLVDRYSIWNEPNYVSWLSPLKSGPKLYRSLYVRGYNAIKSADPGAQVLIGETNPYGISGRATAPLKFLKGVASHGHLKADGYAHHPYDFKHKPTYRYPGRDNATLATLSHLTSTLKSLAHKKRLTTPSGHTLDVYLTEYGYMGSGKYKTPESKRKKYLPQAFTMAQKNPHVREMLQYLLVSPPKKYGFFDTSIVSRKSKLSPTFKSLRSWAKSALAAGRIAAAGG